LCPAGSVRHANDQLIGPGCDGVGDVEAERIVAAAMLANLPAVDPDPRVIVDGLEV
jgi:hypothetical protein